MLKTLKESLGQEELKPRRDRLWILPEAFKILRQKSNALRMNDAIGVTILGKALRRQIRRDQRARIWKVSMEIEQRLNAKDIIGAFDILRNWYKRFTGVSIKPASVDLKKTRKTYVDLFSDDKREECMPYDFEYDGKEVLDAIPEEGEIAKALFKVIRHSPTPS